MRHAVFLLFLLMGTTGKAADNTTVIDKAGDFSIMPYYMNASYRLANASGDLGRFSGDAYGVRFSLKPFPQWLKGFSLVADYSGARAENDHISKESFTAETLSYGFSQYISQSIYLVGLIGSQKLKAQNSGLEAEHHPEIMSMGLGLDLFSIGDSISFLIEAQHQKGYSKRSSAANSDHNLGYDANLFMIGIRWSPSVSFTYTSR